MVWQHHHRLGSLAHDMMHGVTSMLEVIFWICVHSSFSFVLDSYICSRLFSLVL